MYYTPIIKDLDFSLNINLLNNDIFYIIDELAINNMIRNIIFTSSGERFYNNVFGCSVYKYLFENSDSKKILDLKNNIKNQIEYYIPFISLIDIKTEYKENVLVITIIYNWNNKTNTISLNLNENL